MKLMKWSVRAKMLGIVLPTILWLSTPNVWAHKEGQSEHQSYKLGDFQLESGEVIQDFSISYVTHGKLNTKKSNAILLASSLGGNHHRVDFLVGPGKALDTNKYFIIATDAIGNGLTTSPSNSTKQPGVRFPQFNIRDMVNSQHRLVTEKFGITHLVAVGGASMGGMQSLQWAVSYPDFMDAIVSLTGTVRTSPWSIGIFEMSIKMLKIEPDWNSGNYTKQPEQGWRLWTDFVLAMMANAPQGIASRNPTPQEVKDFLIWWEDLWLARGYDANDMIYQTEAINLHNVANTPGMDGDLTKALKSIKAKVLVLIAKNDLLVSTEQIQQDALLIRDHRVVEIPTLYGHFGASPIYSPADVDFSNRIVHEVLEAASMPTIR